MTESRQEAQRLVADQLVLVNGSFAAKSAAMVAPSDQIVLQSSGPTFVSRSGHKLSEALDIFAVDPAGMRCIDVGSSTGGFTDCLLQRGAAQVTAVDVGTNQLHERIRADGRVTVFEQTDIRTLDQHAECVDYDLAVVDVSFISARKVIPAVAATLTPSGRQLVLVKPQFEAGRREVSRGRGVISDPAIWSEAVAGVADAAAEHGFGLFGVIACSTRGAKGNVEFMALLAQIGPTIPDRDALIDEAVRLAAGSEPGMFDEV